MRWQFHFSKAVDPVVFNMALARLQLECQQYDPFVLMTGIKIALLEDMGIIMKASVLPSRKKGIKHEIQGLWGRN